MSAHTPVRAPRVPITRLSTSYEARCHHCNWTYNQPIRAAVIEQAQYHRHLHRLGNIPIEPAPRPTTPS